jgi:hypothetical protein
MITELLLFYVLPAWVIFQITKGLWWLMKYFGKKI